jgi:cytidyltransferase-like protein
MDFPFSHIYPDNELSALKREDETIVLMGGCFDILHPGHYLFIEGCKAAGDRLICLLESDMKVKESKGEQRPIHNQLHRAKKLIDITKVDDVVLLENDSAFDYYYSIIQEIDPDVIAITKDDPHKSTKQQHANLIGAQLVEIMERDARFSTSKIVEYLNDKNEI